MRFIRKVSTMRTITKVSLLALVVLALAGCRLIPGQSADADLTSTSWVLSSLDGMLPLPGTIATLQFGADNSAAGSDGCNRFATTFTQRGDRLSFNQPMASTMMACEELIMNQGSAFMAALAASTRFVASEGELILRNDRKDLAVLTRISQDLAGSEWEVISYNNGREAVVGVLLGTEISANFSPEGQVSGNAGCNQYSAGYVASGTSIEIGQIATTFMFCEQPPGVMEQEGEYLAALQSAATYSIGGDTLEMRTAADQIAVIMTRKVAIDLPVSAPTGPWGRVTAPQGATIRQGPGVDYPFIGFARDGDEGEIIGRDANWQWWAVSLPSERDGMGWVSADLVLALNVEKVPVIEAPPPPVVATPLPPTAAPTAAPTATPTATPTAAPTATPTATPTPVAQISFGADQTNIEQGQCTMLRWSVENIQGVWVYPQGERYYRFPRVGQGSEQVCLVRTTTFEMRVLLRDGATTFREVTVNVAGPPPTAPPTPEPDPLVGTRWDVVSYNNGRGAVTTLLDGSQIDLEFSTNGQVIGNAGCNSYFAFYRVSRNNNIAIGLPSTTSLYCAEIEGVMAQEAEFLAILGQVATFRVDRDRLEMRTADDEVAIIATQVR